MPRSAAKDLPTALTCASVEVVRRSHVNFIPCIFPPIFRPFFWHRARLSSRQGPACGAPLPAAIAEGQQRLNRRAPDDRLDRGIAMAGGPRPRATPTSALPPGAATRTAFRSLSRLSDTCCVTSCLDALGFGISIQVRGAEGTGLCSQGLESGVSISEAGHWALLLARGPRTG
ncbi:Protein of unknown function [Gryllus bimaculatus]|nr:Protein of unknown function [Gryllus bimaculatus]